ncbi:DUF6185 family protein [Streptomyces sp. NPDC051183]|uniref:DUF6185 family protein n=1 Tax=Streptomyces sp. NPDC051183 TaxID=3155165 RepID=UPI00341429F9
MDPCRADQLGRAKFTASAEFDHRGRDYSLLTTTTEVKVPAGWALAPDLLLDPRSPLYRSALRCLLGKVSPDDFYDYEWRLEPLTVKADGTWTTVHYRAVAWVTELTKYHVGPWQLDAGKDEWNLLLQPPPNLAGAHWDDVHVRLGGPGAMTASPAPTFAEGGTELKWQHRKPVETFQVSFRPPAAQHWSAVTSSEGQFWETFGLDSASGAFWYLEASTLLLLCTRRLRRSLGSDPAPVEKQSLKVMKTWAFWQGLLVLAVYQMRFASVAFFLAQLLALATIWRTLREGGPLVPPPSK